MNKYRIYQEDGVNKFLQALKEKGITYVDYSELEYMHGCLYESQKEELYKKLKKIYQS